MAPAESHSAWQWSRVHRRVLPPVACRTYDSGATYSARKARSERLHRGRDNRTDRTEVLNVDVLEALGQGVRGHRRIVAAVERSAAPCGVGGIANGPLSGPT